MLPLSALESSFTQGLKQQDLIFVLFPFFFVMGKVALPDETNFSNFPSQLSITKKCYAKKKKNNRDEMQSTRKLTLINTERNE